jgi:hypothetical protein
VVADRRDEGERRVEPEARDSSERRNRVERNILATPVGLPAEGQGRDRTLRVAAQNLNRLLG